VGGKNIPFKSRDEDGEGNGGIVRLDESSIAVEDAPLEHEENKESEIVEKKRGSELTD